ncbi:hypothetical protein ACFQT0_30020 [Hymenobacter humi]|uniref:DUF1641 domain-containing protein n=1 Tax=Hymenobacter humi TaxID=1411620 RepID=A0ABW2UCE7_9BACT
MKKAQHQSKSKLAKGLPVDLGELDKKYARAISQPMVNGVGPLMQTIVRLLGNDSSKQVRQAGKSVLRLLAKSSRPLLNTLSFQTLLPGGAPAAFRARGAAAGDIAPARNF